jgi:hypothetical protein
MSPDEFALALRVLDAPLFLDNRGTATPLGMEFTATTSDGKSVFVTQLSPVLNSRVTNPDAFVRTLGRHGYQGAGITESGQLYFLELPPVGASLAQRLTAAGPMPASELTDIARAIIDRLAQLAQRGEVHGMITPGTVYLAGGNTVSLRWPGLVPALQAAGVDAAAIAEALEITAFVAPEVQGGTALDTAADIFALGVTLYTALTGRPPFGGRTTATMMAVVLADDGAPVTTVAGTLTTVLLRAIETDPADRWRDLQQLRDALGPDTETRAGTQKRVTMRHGCAGAFLILAGSGLVLWVVNRYIS